MIITKKFTGLVNGNTYFGKVFTANPKGRVNNRADLKSASVTPEEPPKEIKILGTDADTGITGGGLEHI